MSRGHRRSPPCRQVPTGSTVPAAIRGRRGLAAGALAMGGLVTSVLTPAHALTLGNVAVDSALGQPLSARIPVELAEGELLGAGCVSVLASTHPDLGALPRVDVSVPEVSGAGRFALRLTTRQALYEPMYELQVQVRCNGMPLLLRQYVLMLDLPGMAVAPATAAPAVAAPAAATTAPATATTGTSRPGRPTASARAGARAGTPVAAGSRYRVSEGDTLLGIAARVGDRQGRTLWEVANRIFAANPDAFIGNNPDLIKLGSLIVVPAMAAPARPVDASGQAAGSQPSTASLPAMVEAAPALPATAGDAAAPGLPALPEIPSVERPDTAATGTAATTSEAATVGQDAEIPLPAAAPAGMDDERVFVDEPAAAQSEPTAAPASAAAEAAGGTGKQGAPAWLAALIGILIGAAVSLALLRERLVAALGGLARRKEPAGDAPDAGEPPALPATPAPAAPLAFKAVTAPQEATMVVEEHPAADDTIERALPVEEPSVTVEQLMPPAASLDDAADELASLFDEEPDLPLPPAGVGAAAAGLDLDLSEAALEGTLDEDISWIGDETALTPTTHAAALPDTDRSETVEQIDLRTLAQQGGDDPAISQTLKDALALLESDYEDEMTASQRLDPQQREQLFDEQALEDTLVRTGTDFPRRR